MPKWNDKVLKAKSILAAALKASSERTNEGALTSGIAADLR
jgi:hypothetical protein